jgi:hypothetical protein
MIDKFKETAKKLGELVSKKNAQYGDSFNKAGLILQVLYPDGVKPEQYTDMLCVTRIVDKLFRIANGQLEDSYEDIGGYGILGASRNPSPLAETKPTEPAHHHCLYCGRYCPEFADDGSRSMTAYNGSQRFCSYACLDALKSKVGAVKYIK